MTEPLRVLKTTSDRQNVALSLQLLALYGTPSARQHLELAAIVRPPVPTFEEFVHALQRLRN